MRPEPPATLLLSGADLRSLVDLDDAIREVERAFARHAMGGFPRPESIGCPATGGWFPPGATTVIPTMSGALSTDCSLVTTSVTMFWPSGKDSATCVPQPASWTTPLTCH